MRALLVLVVLFGVMGVAYAETRTECSNKAYSVFQGCLENFNDLREVNKEPDLYELWEKKFILEEADKCFAFRRKSKDRFQLVRIGLSMKLQSGL